MIRKNPDDLVYQSCPGCACEISGNICFACEYADKNIFYADGFRKYSPNSPPPIDLMHRDEYLSNICYQRDLDELYSSQPDYEEDYMYDGSFDSSSEVWT